MKYLFLAVALFSIPAVLYALGLVEIKELWRVSKPYIFIGFFAGLAIAAVILIANSGASFRIL
jgi:hypothetical protein